MKNKTITSAELKKFVESDDCERIVQLNHSSYQTKWYGWARKNEIISVSGKKSWNWGAFFFGLFWLLYRKMYLQFFLFFSFLVLPIILLLSLISVGIHLMTELENLGDFLIYVLVTIGFEHFADFMIYVLITIIDGFFVGQGFGASYFLKVQSLFVLMDYAYYLLIVLACSSIILALFADGWYLQKCLKIAQIAREKFDSPSPITSSSIDSSAGDDITAFDVQKKNKEIFLKNAGATNLLAALFFLTTLLAVSWFIASMVVKITKAELFTIVQLWNALNI